MSLTDTLAADRTQALIRIRRRLLADPLLHRAHEPEPGRRCCASEPTWRAGSPSTSAGGWWSIRPGDSPGCTRSRPDRTDAAGQA